MIVNNEIGNLVRLGDYIELIDQRNSNLKFGISDVCGISNNKEIMPTRANVEGTELHNFFVVNQDELIYNSRTTRMGDKIGLGFNDTGKTLITSWNNTAFRIKPECKGELLPPYLFMFFKRSEFDRYTRYNSWGSSTEIFSWESMCEVKIPLPDIDIQQELVDTYNGLKALAEQNEALSKPLTEACRAYIVDCKKKYPEVELVDYIDPCDERNRDGIYTLDDIRGVSTEKKFIDTKANLDGVSLNAYKVVHRDEFAYVSDTSRRGDKIALALNTTNNPVLISSIYTTFRSIDTKKLLPEYLYLILSREEFDRYSRFNSWGSARETFDWSELCRVLIPLPPPDVQQAIVDIYNCAEEAKKIANDAREKMKTLCPALVQRSINGKSDLRGLMA